MQFDKIIDNVIKGAQILGAIGTIYNLLDAPRRQREETQAIEKYVEKEVNRIIKNEIKENANIEVKKATDKYIDEKMNKIINKAVEDIISAKINSIDDRLDAIIAAHEMRRNKQNGHK